MRYIVDHDLHLHSKISLCSQDSGQTNERILQYAKERMEQLVDELGLTEDDKFLL